MELRRKLGILADAAKNDASCASGGAKERDSRESEGIGPVVGTGICQRGCIQLKTMPEVSPDRIAPAGRYADRLSRNVEEILVDGEGRTLDLSPHPKLAWVRKHRLGMPLPSSPPPTTGRA